MNIFDVITKPLLALQDFAENYWQFIIGGVVLGFGLLIYAMFFR